MVFSIRKSILGMRFPKTRDLFVVFIQFPFIDKGAIMSSIIAKQPVMELSRRKV